MAPRTKKTKEEVSVSTDAVVKPSEKSEPIAETANTKKSDATPKSARKSRSKCGTANKNTTGNNTLSIDSKDKKSSAEKTAETAKKKTSRRSTKAQPVQEAEPVTVDTIIEKLKSKIVTAKAADIKGKIAIDIKLYGTFEHHMYILVDNGQVFVEPYEYNDRDIDVSVSVENALAIIDGKISVKDALINEQLLAYGKIGLAFKIAPLFGGVQ